MSSTPEFKSGDLVRLKTGEGPVMVISRPALREEMPQNTTDWLVCSYWSEVQGRYHRESFNPATLVPYVNVIEP